MLTIARNVLLSAVQSIIGAVAKRSTLPILEFLHLTTDGETLTLTATNLEVTAIVRVPHSSEAQTMMLPARRLYEILRALPTEGQVSIDADVTKAVLKCGRSRFTLIAADPMDFPLTEVAGFERTLTVPSATFKAMIDAVSPAMARQDVRYYLNGLLLHCRGTGLNAVAADGHRLSWASLPGILEIANEDAIEAIMPAEAVTELTRLLPGAETLTLGFESNRVKFDLGDRILIAKLIDGKFPDYPRVIPRDPPINVAIEREPFIAALKRVQLLNDDKSSGMCLSISAGNLLLSTRNGLAEESEDALSCDYAGESFEIGLNPSYLLDVLLVLSDETVTVQMVDPTASVKIEAPDRVFVIMPMRL